jgi:hypothetical protein
MVNSRSTSSANLDRDRIFFRPSPLDASEIMRSAPVGFGFGHISQVYMSGVSLPLREALLTGMPHANRSVFLSSLAASRRFLSSTTSSSLKSKSHNHSSRPRPFPRLSRTNWSHPKISTTVKMSTAGGVGAAASAALYAVVSNPAQVAAVPEDAQAKAHHLKNGKGFRNPWDSFTEITAPKIMWGMIS